jgi:hypothetical protein
MDKSRGEKMATFKKAMITADDFANAAYMDNDDCPIARALKRAGLQYVYVRGRDYGYISGGKRFKVYHTSRLQEVLMGTLGERGEYPKSFTFQIPVA